MRSARDSQWRLSEARRENGSVAREAPPKRGFCLTRHFHFIRSASGSVGTDQMLGGLGRRRDSVSKQLPKHAPATNSAGSYPGTSFTDQPGDIVDTLEANGLAPGSTRAAA